MFLPSRVFHAPKTFSRDLSSASAFIKRILASRVELRAFPRLRFHWDVTPENADRIEKKLAELREKK